MAERAQSRLVLLSRCAVASDSGFQDVVSQVAP